MSDSEQYRERSQFIKNVKASMDIDKINEARIAIFGDAESSRRTREKQASAEITRDPDDHDAEAIALITSSNETTDSLAAAFISKIIPYYAAPPKSSQNPEIARQVEQMKVTLEGLLVSEDKRKELNDVLHKMSMSYHEKSGTITFEDKVRNLGFSPAYNDEWRLEDLNIGIRKWLLQSAEFSREIRERRAE
ncbi:hypothetical protein C1H76_7159 [Elsinoe australis]|uniref:Uncharacterized protein n=1 Tax=Elsinoe australis TaxID=40998 RepID=A0A4U7AVM1_9PEZI|nr:hypothetical protein C1H76_7159 [Elsinoe australis]